MEQWHPVDLDSLVKVKDTIWDFFRYDLNMKPVSFKAMACYSYIISNRGIFAADIAYLAGINIKYANKLLEHLESSDLLVSHETKKDDIGTYCFTLCHCEASKSRISLGALF